MEGHANVPMIIKTTKNEQHLGKKLKDPLQRIEYLHLSDIFDARINISTI